MAISSVAVQLQRIQHFAAQHAKDHKKLQRLLDAPTSAEMLNEAKAVTARFADRDRNLADSLDRCARVAQSLRPDNLRRLQSQLRELKQDLSSLQHALTYHQNALEKTTMRVTLVVEEFRTRCRDTYTEHLKCLDLDLRRILKPLVPSKVLDEQIRFRKINNNPSMQSSMQSTIKSELRDAQEEGTGDSADQEARLNAHIELLVNTLETVAKDLIVLCGDVNKRYYQVVDPRELLSGPPTPLAAPLPEYFSFKAADYVEDQLDLLNIIDPTLTSESQRQILVRKLMQLNQQGPSLLDANQAEKLRKRLQSLGRENGDVRNLNLEELFRDDQLMPVSERENLVYSLIHSERRSQRDVTLDELINASRESHERKKPRLVRKSSEESGLPPPVDKCERRSEAVTPLADNSSEEAAKSAAGASSFYTPPADALRKPQAFFEQHRKSLPPITMLDKKASHGKSAQKIHSAAKLMRDDQSSKDMRVRSVTPVQSKRSLPDRKPGTPAKKSSKSPAGRKLAKKQSVS